MDIDVARHLVRAGFRSADELTKLIPLLKETCPTDEYERFLKAIAAAVAEITLQLFNRLFTAHPGLEAEVEDNIQRFGRYL